MEPPAHADSQGPAAVGESGLSQEFQELSVSNGVEDERPQRLQRLNERGDSVPGSQSSGGSSQAVPVPAAPSRRRSRAEASARTPAILRCAMCGPAAGAYQAADDRGLRQHMCRVHLGQALTAEAVAQLRSLDKVACRFCARIRARTTAACGECRVATPTRPIQLGERIQTHEGIKALVLLGLQSNLH